MTAPSDPPASTIWKLRIYWKPAAAHGASNAGYVTLRLPYEIKDLFHEWLAQHFPDRAAKIINHIREMHGGKDYDAKWF